MAYTPQTWVDNNASYPLSAARMNTMESGISSAASVADQGHRILTTAERDALTGVTTGTTIYNSTLGQIQSWNGSAWIEVGNLSTTSGVPTVSNQIVPPFSRVRNSANLAIPTAAVTPITFDADVYDTDDMHSTSLNTNRLTINTPGIYLITGHISFAGNATGSRDVAIRYAGTTYLAYVNVPASSNGNIFSISTAYAFVATDWIELVVYQNSGGNLNVLSGSAYSPEFSATWLGRVS